MLTQLFFKLNKFKFKCKVKLFAMMNNIGKAKNSPQREFCLLGDNYLCLNSTHEETILKILGNGGCKKAFQLSEERALLLPNMDINGISAMQSRWPRIVEEEIQMSKFLQKIGLLAKDIAKLVHYQLLLGGDSFNLAIVRNYDGDKIRYFGFDYTSKSGKILIPVVQEKTSSQINKNQETQLLARINTAFSNAIRQVLFQEYQAEVDLPQEAYNIIDELKDTYSREILQEVYALQTA